MRGGDVVIVYPDCDAKGHVLEPLALPRAGCGSFDSYETLFALKMACMGWLKNSSFGGKL